MSVSNAKPRPLRDRLKYEVEDLRLRAWALDNDKMYTELEISQNILLAAHFKSIADLLAKWIREDEAGAYET